MYRREGFPGQRIRVLPRPLIRAARDEPILRRLMVTDAGVFPRAAAHGRARIAGAEETIVMVCAQGAGWVQVDGRREVRVSSGDAVVLARGVRHRYHADAQDPWTIWWMHVTGADADEFEGSILASDQGPVVPLRTAHTVAGAVEEAVSALEQDDTRPTLITASGAAWRALALIAASRMRGGAPTNDRIAHVQDYLRSTLDTSFTVAELAAMAGLGASHFAALFRAASGTSVTNYLKRLRSARAGELLMTTDMTVAEIGAAVGYADALYFSRQFRAVNGVSPSAYRAKARLENLPA